MTMTVANVAESLNEAFNLGKAAGWDPVGLQFGDPGAEASSIAVCHEVTPAVADRLLDLGIKVAVTYHPLLFRPASQLIAGDDAPGRAFRLIAGGVALFAVHTAFDVLPGGSADALAAALGLQEVSGFGPLWGRDVAKVITFVPAEDQEEVVAAMAEAGAGNIGRYSHCSFRSGGIGTFFPQSGSEPASGETGRINAETENRVEMIAPAGRVDAVVAAMIASHPYEEPAYDVIQVSANAGFVGRRGHLSAPTDLSDVAQLVKEQLGGVVRMAGSGRIESVGVVPGSGGGMLSAAGTDVVITGDVSHHQARDAVAGGTSVIDPGHAATERPGVQALYAAVAEMYEEVIDLTRVDSDPWKEP